jgi:hypothetical protein
MLAEYSWVYFRTVGCHSQVTHLKAKLILMGRDISESQDVYYYKSGKPKDWMKRAEVILTIFIMELGM